MDERERKKIEREQAIEDGMCLINLNLEAALRNAYEQGRKDEAARAERMCQKNSRFTTS